MLSVEDYGVIRRSTFSAALSIDLLLTRWGWLVTAFPKMIARRRTIRRAGGIQQNEAPERFTQWPSLYSAGSLLRQRHLPAGLPLTLWPTF